MENYPKPVSKQCTKIILNQIDNSICKINEGKGVFHIGVLCYIKCENKNIPVLITTYKIINEKFLANKNSINIFTNNKFIEIEFGNKRYLNEYLDLSIIEIKNNHNEILNYIELDDNLYEKDSEFLYNKESIYIINYYNGNNYVSYGVINDIIKSKLICSCNINSI